MNWRLIQGALCLHPYAAGIGSSIHSKRNSGYKWNILFFQSFIYLLFHIFYGRWCGCKRKCERGVSSPGLWLNVTLYSCQRPGTGMPHWPLSAFFRVQLSTVTACKCCFCNCLKCWEACYTSWQLMDHCADWWHTMPWRISLNAAIFPPICVCYACTSKSLKSIPPFSHLSQSPWRCDSLGSLFIATVKG